MIRLKLNLYINVTIKLTKNLVSSVEGESGTDADGWKSEEKPFVA